MKLTPVQRKWLLTLHILFASIMLGGTMVAVILSVTALNTDSEDVLRACYTVMRILAESSFRMSTIVTVVTGILLSIWTNWGLFRYYWIIAKEALTLLSIGIAVIGFYYWTLNGLELVVENGLGARHLSAYRVNVSELWFGLILQVISLVSMFALSVFKPWGRRKQAD